MWILKLAFGAADMFYGRLVFGGIFVKLGA